MKKVTALLAGAVVLLTALSSWATPVLTLRLSEEGFAPQEYSSSNGLLSLAILSYGTFSINFVGGNSSLPFNSGHNTLSITTFNLANTASTPKTLNLAISGTDYGLAPFLVPPNNALGSFSVMAQPMSGSTFSLKSYLSTSNTLFGMDTLIGEWNQALLGTVGAASGSRYLSVPTVPYALTEVLAITQGTSAMCLGIPMTFSQFGAWTEITAVPEPGCMLLIGTGCLALTLWNRRRRSDL
jgi:hypothetical protein